MQQRPKAVLFMYIQAFDYVHYKCSASLLNTSEDKKVVYGFSIRFHDIVIGFPDICRSDWCYQCNNEITESQAYHFSSEENSLKACKESETVNRRHLSRTDDSQ